MPLDERQRLQDRVVDARGDLGALLAADACGALRVAIEREAPEPGPGDEQERSRDGARRQHVRRGAAALEQQHRADSGEQEAAVRERLARAEAAALSPRKREPGGDERDPTYGAIRKTDGVEEKRAGDEYEHRRPPRPARRAVCPQREVERDAGATRQREQSKDEPDKRHVDAEGPRDS